MLYFLTVILVIFLSACGSKEAVNNAGEESSSDIIFSGTVTLPYSNVTIPTLNQFQYYGLEIPIYSGYEQWNYKNVENIDKDAYYAFYERIGATFDEYRRKIDLVFEANGVLEDQGSYQQRPEDIESHRVSFAYVSPVAVQWETGCHRLDTGTDKLSDV